VICLRLVSDGKVTIGSPYLPDDHGEPFVHVGVAGGQRLHVAMEATASTGSLVWHILDDGEFELVLANAARVKNVPGRKTDQWCHVAGEPLAHCLIRASFVPNARTQEMRNLQPRASNWFVSRRATWYVCKRHSMTPTSNWIRFLLTSWAKASAL
jgi:hypothetical protein